MEAFSLAFMQRALIAGGFLSLIAPLYGMFLVQRRMPIIADTLAHTSLLGISIGLVLGVSPTVSIILSSIIAALIVEFLRYHGRLQGDSVLSVMLTSSLALTTVFLSFSNSLQNDLFGYLFGSMVTVTSSELWVLLFVLFIVFIVYLMFHRQFFVIAVDEDVALASGIRVGLFNTILMLGTALFVGVSVRIVGMLLIGGLVVIPVLTASQFRLGFQRTTLLASILSFLSVFFGLLFSFWYNIPTSGAVILVGLLMLIISLVITKK